MAILALHSAATGLSALSTNIDVIANNMANVNTEGFKASRAYFEDLLYQHLAQPGVESANGEMRTSGLDIGLGVRISQTARDFSPGSAINTKGKLDIMIDGDGFFAIDTVINGAQGIGYTRAGHLAKNVNGELVLGNSDGQRIQPPVTIPTDAQEISISSDGRVLVLLPGNDVPQEVGQIQLSTFTNPAGLKAEGKNIYSRTIASGDAIQAIPGENGTGKLLQGFLENSNVDPVGELIELIKTQRAFEMNSQTIQAADQTLQVVSNLRR